MTCPTCGALIPTAHAVTAGRVCRICGEGVNKRGCLIRGAWSTAADGYQWTHRWCRDNAGDDPNENEEET